MKKGFLARLPRLLGYMIVGLLGTAIIVLIIMNDNRTYESPMLLTVLNVIFITLISLYTAVIAFIGYIRMGLWRFLALGTASVVFGLTALVTGPLMEFYGANTAITFYNVGSLLSAFCFSLTVMRELYIPMAGKTPISKRFISVVSLFLALGIVGVIILLSVQQVFSPFFIQGTGSTPIRQIVLGLSIAFMGIAAINSYRDFIETRTSFNYWFALGLFCIAMGFFGVYNITSANNALNWVSRLAQYIGNIYLLFASMISLRKFQKKSILSEDLITTLFQEPALNYSMIMDIEPNGVAVVNNHGRILRWNSKAENLFGYTSDEIASISLVNLFLPNHSNIIGQTLLSIQNKPGESRDMELAGKCKNGSICPILLSISGKMTGLGWMGVVTFHNNTKQKKAEEELQKYAAKLEVVNKELESFAYSVSHDLRTPLRTLDGFSELVLMEYNDRLDETGKNYLTRIRKASQTMDKLTEDLLKLSSVTRYVLHSEKCNLSEIAFSIADELRQAQPDRSVVFNITHYMTVYGDKALLQILMRNLLENSWKYTSDCTDARIEVGIYKEGKEQVCYIKDNGIGFDMKYYDKLFAPFQRLHNVEQYAGNGIGLATVQRIIQRHGGRIWAESEPGKETAFYFALGEVEENVNA